VRKGRSEASLVILMVIASPRLLLRRCGAGV
jgi:hypothetical protein